MSFHSILLLRLFCVKLWSEFFKAGSVGGICTDIVLFPLDTIKTRAQSQLGFQKSGGYSGLFRGVGSAALGSAPSGNIIDKKGVKYYEGRNGDSTISHMQ